MRIYHQSRGWVGRPAHVVGGPAQTVNKLIYWLTTLSVTLLPDPAQNWAYHRVSKYQKYHPHHVLSVFSKLIYKPRSERSEHSS